MARNVRGNLLVLWRPGEVIGQRIRGDVEGQPRDGWYGDAADGRTGRDLPQAKAVERQGCQNRERPHRLDEVMPREVAARQPADHRHHQPDHRQANLRGECSPPRGQCDGRDPEDRHVDDEGDDAVPGAAPDECGGPARGRITDERLDRPAPESGQGSGEADQHSAAGQADDNAAGGPLRGAPSPSWFLEPEEPEHEQDDVDRRRLAKSAGGDQKQRRPEPTAAEHEQERSGERQHHEDLGVRRQQSWVSGRGEDAVKQRREQASAASCEVSRDQVEEHAGPSHRHKTGRVNRCHLVVAGQLKDG